MESKDSWKYVLIPFFSHSVYHWPADGRPLRELSVQQVSAHAALALLWGGDQAQGLCVLGSGTPRTEGLAQRVILFPSRSAV